MAVLAFTGVALGLAISAAAPTEEMAITLIPMAIIPQIILSGMIAPVEKLSKRLAEWLITVYWGNRGLDALLERAAELAGPLLAPWLPGPEHQARAAEWLSRVVLSYTLAPARDTDLSDPAAARQFSQTFILPGLTRSTT